MNSGKQYIYGFIVLISLGFMGWYYAQPPQHSNISKRQLAYRPDTVIKQLQVTEYNEAGQLVSHLQTPRLVHYPSDNTSTLQQPLITLYRPQQPPWHISADHGISEQGAAKITLWDHVVLQQVASAPTKATYISTARLIYYPKSQLATTQQLITIQQPGLRVTSQGMNAYLKQQTVQLLHQARGTYEQQH